MEGHGFRGAFSAQMRSEMTAEHRVEVARYLGHWAADMVAFYGTPKQDQSARVATNKRRAKTAKPIAEITYEAKRQARELIERIRNERRSAAEKRGG